MVLEDSWESPGQQGDQTVHPKENQPWIFNGRTDAEDEVPILWPLDAKIPFTGKDPDDGKDWGQEEKLVTEDEMAQQHHLTWWTWESEQTLGDGEGQGSLTCYSPWTCKEKDMIYQLNNNNLVST